MNRNANKLKDARAKCQEAKVGETIACPSCGTMHVKKSYQSVFCKSKSGTVCKDNYWNNVDPDKRCNTTRISPASAAWMERVDSDDFNPDDYEHPFSSEALGQC